MRQSARVRDVLGRAVHRRALAIEARSVARPSGQLALALDGPPCPVAPVERAATMDEPREPAPCVEASPCGLWIESRAFPGTFYLVRQGSDGTWWCSCKAAVHGRPCRHVALARDSHEAAQDHGKPRLARASDDEAGDEVSP